MAFSRQEDVAKPEQAMCHAGTPDDERAIPCLDE
jgi:hypothetical protein